MSGQKSKGREELERAVEQLKKIQKGNTSKEVVDAIIEKIKEEPSDYEKAARPKNSPTEIQPNT